jgi:uncharacterized protein YkwD
VRLRRSLPVLAAAFCMALVPATAPAADSAATTPAARASSACPGANLQPTAKNVREVRAAVVCLLNLERARHGLPTLRPNGTLARAAERHSRNMVKRRFFAHVNPAGVTPLNRVRAAGYLHNAPAFTVGENIGWGEAGLSTPLAMHRAWMRSPGHRANLLRAGFRDIGIGIALGVPGSHSRGATYTQDFGSRA